MVDKLRGKIVTQRDRWNFEKMTASSKKMRETSTRKQMRDQNTKNRYQQCINSWKSGRAYGKMRVKDPTKNGLKKRNKKYEKEKKQATEELKWKANNNLNKLKDLMMAKEICLDKLRETLWK